MSMDKSDTLKSAATIMRLADEYAEAECGSDVPEFGFDERAALRSAVGALQRERDELLEALRMCEQLAHGTETREFAIRNTARAAIERTTGVKP